MEKQQIRFIKFALNLLNTNNMCLYWIGYGWGQEGGWWHECTLLGELHGGCRKIFFYNIYFHSVKSTKITWTLCGCVMWWCEESDQNSFHYDHIINDNLPAAVDKARLAASTNGGQGCKLIIWKDFSMKACFVCWPSAWKADGLSSHYCHCSKHFK